jgi:signal transduction histidine kinase
LGERQPFSLEAFIKDATEAALLGASAGGCHLKATPVKALLILNGNRDLLLAALANLIQNAFKFTHPGTEITLSAYAVDDRIYIDVKDHCGGLPHGDGEKIFTPFSQRGDDRTGLGLGLSIARKSVEADEGTLTVRDVPGTGCVFTMNLPRHGRQDGQS